MGRASNRKIVKREVRTGARRGCPICATPIPDDRGGTFCSRTCQLIDIRRVQAGLRK